MKKSKLLIPLAGIAALGATVTPLVTLSSCKEKPTMITVTFDYGLETEEVEVEKGGSVTEPTKPTYEGMTFTGWYKDKARTEAFDFKTEKPTKTLTLYAGWAINDVVGIALDDSKIKDSYYQGEALDLDDLIVWATLEGGSTVQIPVWACDCSPYNGQALMNTGWQTVSVTVGGITEYTYVYVDVFAFGLDVSLKSSVKTINGFVPVGTTINKGSFNVKVKDTENPEWHDVGSTLLWQCDKLPLPGSYYTFETDGAVDFNFTYKNEPFKLTLYAVYNNDYEYDMPMEITLPRKTNTGGGTDDGFESLKQITVLDGETKVTNRFKFTILTDEQHPSTQNSIKVDETTGLIQTLAAGTSWISVQEYDEEEEEYMPISEPIKVNVVDYAGAETITVDEGGNAVFPIYQLDNEGVCVIPDKVILPTATDPYNVVLGKPTSAISNLTVLYLPNGMKGIDDQIDAETDFPSLHSVYYDGTKANYSALLETDQAPWGNDFVVGVQCIDGLDQTNIVRRAEAELKLDSSNRLALQASYTKTQAGGYNDFTVQIDLSKYYMGPITDGDAFAPIKLNGWLYDSDPTKFKVYADGVPVDPASGVYEFKEVSGVPTLTWKNYSAVAGKNITLRIINLTANVGTNTVSSLCNITPTGITVTARHWNVGDTFRMSRNTCYWVFANGKKLPLPDEYVKDYVKTNWTDGYKFVDTDRGVGKILTVEDKIFGFEGKDTFNVY